MSIKVESTSIDQGAAPSGSAAATPVETKSAPAASAAEQIESTESDTEETEAKESDDSEAETSDEDVETKDSEGDKPKKKSGSQRRKERAERAEAEVTRLQRLVEEMALKGAGDSKSETRVEPKTADGKPNPDTFDTHAEYVEALTDWKIEQRAKAEKEIQHRSQLKTEQEKAIEAHVIRVKLFAEKKKDFQDVLESVDDVPVSPTVEGEILSSENGPEIMYELAKDRAEFERINKLPPLAAARAIGKIEARLAVQASDDKKQEPKKITKAPKPIDPVGGKSGSGEKSIFDPDISQAEYERIRAKQRTA